MTLCTYTYTVILNIISALCLSKWLRCAYTQCNILNLDWKTWLGHLSCETRLDPVVLSYYLTAPNHPPLPPSTGHKFVVEAVVFPLSSRRHKRSSFKCWTITKAVWFGLECLSVLFILNSHPASIVSVKQRSISKFKIACQDFEMYWYEKVLHIYSTKCCFIKCTNCYIWVLKELLLRFLLFKLP